MTDMHTAIALGIERGLSDLGGELSKSTPSMLAYSVIDELRKAGPDLFAAPSPLPDSETEWASVSEIAGFLSTIMNTDKARGAAKFLDRGYRLTRREVHP